MNIVSSINCSLATTINENTKNNSIKYNKILVGSYLREKNLSFDLKGILNFKPSIQLSSNISFIYLYIYVNDLAIKENDFIKLRIYCTDYDYNLSKINLDDLCKTLDNNNCLITRVNKDIKNKYIKIDISKFINYLSSPNLNIIIEGTNKTCSNIIQLSSYNTDNPPFIVIEDTGTKNTLFDKISELEKEMKELINVISTNNNYLDKLLCSILDDNNCIKKDIHNFSQEIEILKKKINIISIEPIN